MTGSQSVDERYIYDGTSSANLLLVLDNAGAVTQRYLQGPGANQVLAEETVDSVHGNATRWALADHEGSVRDVTDNSGAVANHIVYDSFGNILSQNDDTQAIRRTRPVKHTFAPVTVEASMPRS